MKTWNTVLRLSAALLLVLLPLGSCAPAANHDSSPTPPFSLNLKDAGNSYSPFTAPTLDGTAWDMNSDKMLGLGSSAHSTPFGIIVILNTETGNATRTVEVSGLVLGQALTNDSLVVETSQHFYPAGTGTLNVFSFTNPQAEPTSFRTDRWLTGATSDSVLVSAQKMREYDDLPTALTRISTSGEELGTVTGVTDVHDRSWVFRYQDPEAATAAIRAGSTDKLSKELFNIDSGVAFDITGLDVVSADLSTGSGFLLRRSVPDDTDQQKTSYVPAAWLPATPDGKELRTDDVAWFRGGNPNKQESLYTMRTIRMGEKPD